MKYEDVYAFYVVPHTAFVQVVEILPYAKQKPELYTVFLYTVLLWVVWFMFLSFHMPNCFEKIKICVWIFTAIHLYFENKNQSVETLHFNKW